MISKRFSPKVAQHINEMTSKKLKDHIPKPRKCNIISES